MSNQDERDKLLQQRMNRSEKKSYLSKDRLNELIGESNIEKLLKKSKQTQLLNIDTLDFAPKDINFFPSISEEKMNEMMYSIIRWGLFSPIIVWQKKDGRYMILSGANRVKCFRNILEKGEDIKKEMNISEEEKKELENIEIEKYKEIPSYVYKYEEINEEEAKEITIETNYVQRDGLKEVKNKIMLYQIEYMQKRKDLLGKTFEESSEEMGIPKRTFQYYKKIKSTLIKDLLELFKENQLSVNTAKLLINHDKDEQQIFLDNINDINNHVKFLNFVRKEDLEIDATAIELFNDAQNSETILSIKVPAEYKEEFKEYVENFLKEKGLSS